MYKENTNRISVKTILDKRFRKKNGLFPIKVQVLHRRVQKYYSTGKDLSEADWEKLTNTRNTNLIKIRSSIKASFDLVYRVVEELSLKGKFSFDNLSIRLGLTSGNSLNTCLQIKMESLKKEGRIGTMLFYKVVLISLEKYTGKEVPFENVTVDWLRKYEAFLLKNNMRYATIGMRMRGIRTMMNLAKKDGLINDSQYPFGKGKYEIRTGESIKKALTLEQISKFVKYTNYHTRNARNN